MFARKLASDFERTQVSGPVEASEDNLWHRISGGSSGSAPLLDANSIAAARGATSLISVSDDPALGGIVVPDDRHWMKAVLEKIHGDPNRRWVVLLDNAERGHFLQSLVELSDMDFIKMRHQPEAAALAAQRFVGYARNRLRGCLFVVLTNDLEFAATVDDAVNAQHQGMLVRTDLPLPGPAEKETVVRVNTNRLNHISYWYCLDRAGPSEKSAVYTALSGAETFPGSFAAVDTAIKSSSRQGRRAKTCLLSLVVLTKDVDRTELGQLGHEWRTEVDHEWLSVVNFDEKWATSILPPKDAGLLESEWTLRVVALGEPFSKSLLSADPMHISACSKLLTALRPAFGPGTQKSTLENNASELRRQVDTWPDTSNLDIEASFWRLGQRRSTIYEPILTQLLPGYNQTSTGFLGYRPDFVVAPYKPCSILLAGSPDSQKINQVIYRDAHVFEFTAMDQFTAVSIQTYLRNKKLSNYVEVVREQ